MAADLGSLHGILKDPTRRRILSALNGRGELAYVEILGLLEIEHTGKLNYHLKLLGDLITKNENGRYSLTEKGKLAIQVMVKFQPPPGQNNLTTLHVGRTGLGKLLFVLSIPSFILSLIPLSQDYRMASDLSLLLGIITVMFLVFGAAFITPSGQLGNGFGSFRQMLRYGGLEFFFMFLVLIAVVVPARFVFSTTNGIAYVVYFGVLPGFATWLVMALRLRTHAIGEVLKVPAAATIFLWIGGLVLAIVAEFGLGAQVGFFTVYGFVLAYAVPMTVFLFLGILATEGAYRLVGWKGQTGV